MRIIQANKFYYPRGGAETYMLSISRWLEEQGHIVIPFAMKHHENFPSKYEKYFVSNVETEFRKTRGDKGGQRKTKGYEMIRTFGRMVYSLEARRKLATLIAQERPDLCHIHNIYTQISPSILHTLSDQKIPVVMTVHDHHLISPQYGIWAEGCGKDYRNVGIIRGTFSRFHKNSALGSFAQVAAYKLHRLLRIYEKHVAVFIAPSNYIKHQMVIGGFPSEKIRINYYGINTNEIQSFYQHKGYFLFVGRLSEEKGVETIIHLAKLLPEITFKIAGHGPQMEYLHHFALDAPNVEFLGFRNHDELRVLYKDACAVLLPSRMREVFPLVALEAMSHGKPVIASDVGGVSEIVEDRVNGFLIHPTDLHGWAEAVLRLYHDTDLHLRMFRAARQTIEQKFRLDEHYRRLMNIYQEVAK